MIQIDRTLVLLLVAWAATPFIMAQGVGVQDIHQILLFGAVYASVLPLAVSLLLVASLTRGTQWRLSQALLALVVYAGLVVASNALVEVVVLAPLR